MTINRREAAQLSGASPTTVKKALDQRVIPVKRSGSRHGIEIADVPVLTMLGELTEMRLALKHKRRVRAWLHSPKPTRELQLAPALILRRVDTVEQARRRAERYARLRAKWIASDPDIKGGEPVIKGSRVSVHTLADRIATGEDPVILAEDFPHIPAEAREVALQYARANPRRGRPKRHTAGR
ncbi:MAG TPA: DUF433 domain-containing protein [Solirubrobacteraceae bacterium]|nr:DUF433 domain-containing protein [Solirubrobacteraceae bacterium]